MKRNKDLLYKHLQIFTLYLLSKSNLDVVIGEHEEATKKISLASLLILNYVPHSSTLYENILTYLRTIFQMVSSHLGASQKGYRRLIEGIEKKTVTKNHTIKPKISKEVKKKIEEFKSLDILKWHDEDDESSLYFLLAKTANTFKMLYQPWRESWAIFIKQWDKPYSRVFEIEADALKIDIRTLAS